MAQAKPIEGEIKDIPIELIDEPKDDVREWISAEHIDSLAESLNAIGLIHEPVVVNKEGRYEIVSGHCRYLAARKLGWETLRCKIVKKGEVDQDFMKLHENMYRQDLSAVEKARAIAKVKEKYQFTDEEIAKQYGMSRPWVTRILHALKWPEDLQRANADGVLGFEVCDVLRKINDDNIRRQYIRYAVEDGCTKRLAVQWYNEWLRNERIKEQLRAREENLEDHPLIRSDDELLEDARAQQQAAINQRLGGLRKRCSLCGREFPMDQMITFDLCPDCVQWLYDNARKRVGESVDVQKRES